jgi:uncharacterized protein (TIGR02302 family)
MDRKTTDAALRPIEIPLRLTLAGLWAERLCRSFWPLWSILIATIAALALGAQDHLPLEAAWFGLVALAAGGLWALVHGLRHFRPPSRLDAMARLDATLPGQPIAALRDHQATGTADPAAVALWAAHRERMAARAAKARAVEPDLRLASRDPFALRYVALTVLMVALMFGSLWRVASVSALAPGGVSLTEAGPSWEGWAQPPAYTGKPTLYLNDITAATLSLPAGSRIQLRLYGEPGSLILSETVSGRTEVPPASDAAQDFLVTRSGKIAIEGAGGQEWQVAILPDAIPSVTPEGKISREAGGRFKQAFAAKDDYGITSGQVTITLDLPAVNRRFGLVTDPETVEPVVLDLPQPLRGARNAYTETLIDDLSEHVFSNLPVVMSFAVTDAAGQTGVAQPLHVTLPGRRFFDPLAASLIEMRRDLLWTRVNAARAAQILKAITYQPEGLFRDNSGYLRLREVIRAIDRDGAAMTLEARDALAAELWSIALLVEEGDLASAKERLRRAQDRLDEAIRNGADPAEIDELMQELRDALNDYMQQLAEQSESADGLDEPQDGQNQMTMSQDQLQQMLDELQKLMEEGRTAEAAELMERLRQFMENMQVTQGEGGQGQGSPGQQAMRDLGQTLRDQQGLSDDAFRDLQDGQEGNDQSSRPPGQGQQQGQGQDGGTEQGQNDQTGAGGTDPQNGEPDNRSLAERQEDLRNQLDALNRDSRLPGAGSEAGEAGREALDRAGRAMDGAEEALRDGDLPRALDRQAEAMEAMREGIRELGEALADEQTDQLQRQAEAGQSQERGDPQGQRDPLGREPGDGLHIGSDRNLLQGEDVYRRAQELLDEIRKRSGQQSRPEGERDYLKRLLDLF